MENYNTMSFVFFFCGKIRNYFYRRNVPIVFNDLFLMTYYI